MYNSTSNCSNSAFYNALMCPSAKRTEEDINIIYNYLRQLDVLERVHDAPLRSVCRTARLERRPAGYVLFRKEQLNTCWYILLTGSVRMDSLHYKALSCFGRRNSMNLRRNSDCVVVEPSDMIVIDYPDVQTVTVHHQHQNSGSNGGGGGNHKLSQTHNSLQNTNIRHQQLHFLDSSNKSGGMYKFHQTTPRKQSATAVGIDVSDNKSSTMIRRCCASPSAVALAGGGMSGNAAAIAGYNHEVVAHNCSPSSSNLTSNAHYKLSAPCFSRNLSNSVSSIRSNVEDGGGDGANHSYGKLNNNYFIVNNNKLCAPSLKVAAAPLPPTASTREFSTSDNATPQTRLLCASGTLSNMSTQNFESEHTCSSCDSGDTKSHHHRGGHPFRRSFHMEELHNIQSNMDKNLHVNSSQTQNVYRFQRNDSPSKSEMPYQSQYPTHKHRFYGPNRWPPSMMINTNTINSSNATVATNQINQHNFYLYHHQRGSSEQPSDVLLKGSQNYNYYSMQAPQPPPGCPPSTSGASVYHKNYWSSSFSSSNNSQQRHQLTLPISGVNNNNEKSQKDLLVNDLTDESNYNNGIKDNMALSSSSQIVMTGTGTLTSRALLSAADENRLHINSNNSALLPPSSSSHYHHQHMSGHCRRKSDASAGSGPLTNSGGGLTVVKVRAQHGSGSATSLSSSTGGGNRKILRARSTVSSTASGPIDGDEFLGLPETAVDSDYDLDDDDDDEDESCPSHDSFQELRDNVRECLEKDPAERCAEDISTLMEFMHQMQALANLPLSIKRQLCLKMVFAIVPEAGTMIMRHGERIDSWSVVVNGAVEHVKASTGERIEHRLGECFGVEPNPQPQYHDGEMRTLVDDCEFVLVEHGDFCSIMCTLNQHIELEADNNTGEVVREAERRIVGNQVELLITKALPDRLISQLVADDFSTSTAGGTTDAHFIEDFLLMYRVFIRDPTTIVRRLLDWFHSDNFCGRNGSLTDDSSVSMENEGQHQRNSSCAVSYDDCIGGDNDMEDGAPRHSISGDDSRELDETMTSTNPSDGHHYEQHQQRGSVIAVSGGTRRYRERVARIILLWANNHFSDFESNIEMMRLLDEFEQLLDEVKMHNQQTLLNITCSVKSKPRVVTLTRSDRSQPLPFRIVGFTIGGVTGSGSGGIFISDVEPNSPAERAGLKRGDEILEMNNHSFKQITSQRAHELLCDSTHISLTIKSNLMGFKEMLFHNNADSESVDSGGGRVGGIDAEDSCGRVGGQHSSMMVAEPHVFPAPRRHKSGSTGDGSALDSIGPSYTSAARLCQAINNVNTMRGPGHQSGYGSSKYGTPSSRTTSKMFDKLFTLLKGSSVTAHEHGNVAAVGDENGVGVDSTDEAHCLRTSRSNPDISAQIVRGMPSGIAGQAAALQVAVANRCSSFSANSGGGGQSSYLHSIEQAVKVYRADQSFRYLIVYPDTTARGLVQMALQEFCVHQHDGGSTSSADWMLYECTVTREGVIKQRRLPDDAHGLAERIALSSRFYLKNCARSENLLPDELAPELLKESRFGLYTLSAQFLATQLTIQDFSVFSSIEPTEYVDSLFQLGDEHTSWPHLCTFEAIFNREMWWVVTEICAERNVYRRSKLIKKFIKVARFCRDLRNFNSMFAIVSGLEKPAVRRLSHSWERVSGKYMKMFADIQQLMDPSRNMSKYRQHLASVALDPPVIPIYPILRKDLIFAHEANPTFVGKLINFEKLRMIARIIRSIQRLNSVQFDVEMVNAQMAHGIDVLSVSTGGSAASAMRRLGGAASKQASAAMTGLINGASSVGGGPSSSATSSGQSSRRKLYERMLMLRKVKAYLSDLPCCDSESELDRRSLECEPAAPGLGGSGTIGFSSSAKTMNVLFYGNNGGGLTASSKMDGSNSMSPLNATGGSGGRGSGISNSHHRRLASPSPSSLSSISGHSAPVECGAQPQHRHHNNRHQLPKFGAESPHAVQKMMSLVQNSKVLKQQTAPSSPTLTRLNATTGGGGGNSNNSGCSAKRISGQDNRHSLAFSKRSLSRGRSVGDAAESDDEDADQTLLLVNERIVE